MREENEREREREQLHSLNYFLLPFCVEFLLLLIFIWIYFSLSFLLLVSFFYLFHLSLFGITFYHNVCDFFFFFLMFSHCLILFFHGQCHHLLFISFGYFCYQRTQNDHTSRTDHMDYSILYGIMAHGFPLYQLNDPN